jgi:predicted nucleotide-binding protein
MIIDFREFPEGIVKPFLKEFLIEIYDKKQFQFVNIVVSLLTYYSRYNQNLKDGKPTPIDDNLMRIIGFDLLDMDYDEPDIRMYFNMEGYDLDALLSMNDPKPSPTKTEKKSVTIAKKKNSMLDKPNRKIFIVHGHNDKLKTEVVQYLSALDLEPIVLQDSPTLGKTIIELVEHYVALTSFAIVILTKDDFGIAKKDFDINRIRKIIEELEIHDLGSDRRREFEELCDIDFSFFSELADLSEEMVIHMKPRARQNVIFELGITIGILGRDRVRVLYEEGVELPTDIHGLVYISLDSDWKKKLAQEIDAAGIKIDEKYL